MIEILSVIFAGVGALAAVASAIAAFSAKAEVKRLKLQIGDNQDRDLRNEGSVSVTNEGRNSGVILGMNTGDVNGR